MYSKKSKMGYGQIVNCLVGAVGIICILFGVVFYCYEVASTILLSIGASIFATAIVTWLNAKYILKPHDAENLAFGWKIINLYETKADMNTLDANDALKQCSKSIDIIAEGLSNYRAAQGEILKSKILEHHVKVRIISCDSVEMLRQRAKDESVSGVDDGANAVQKVKELRQWVEELRKELGNHSEEIEIRYHASYPGFSYLRIDEKVFVSANLWRKQSQQSFALGLMSDGQGGNYFKSYFESLWESDFVHKECRLPDETGKSCE